MSTAKSTSSSTGTTQRGPAISRSGSSTCRPTATAMLSWAGHGRSPRAGGGYGRPPCERAAGGRESAIAAKRTASGGWIQNPRREPDGGSLRLSTRLGAGMSWSVLVGVTAVPIEKYSITCVSQPWLPSVSCTPTMPSASSA